MVYFQPVHLLFLVGAVAAQATTTTTSSPTATSNLTVVQQNYAYYPSTVAAAIFAGLYGIVAIILFFRLFANRTWWGLCLPIGAAVMSAGFILRDMLALDPNSLSFFLSQLLFILLSPAGFLAFNYILYGRFVINCIPRGHSLIRPERTARYFVLSDFTTLVIQGIGGSLLTSSDASTASTGIDIVIGGLALQALSFLIYTCLVYYVYWSLKRSGVKPLEEPWGMILKLLFFTSALFLLRCIYRTVELGQGLGNGYLYDHEVFFYVLDSLPLLFGIIAYCIYWPSRYLRPADYSMKLSCNPSVEELREDA